MYKNKKHISEEDFQRYLENQMTNAERNTFERELQKHPFEAEALEGLQQLPAKKIQNDLNDLSKKISHKSKKRDVRFRWAAAATLLLLISTGIIWFQLKDKSPTTEMAETKSVQKQEQDVIPETQPEIEKITDMVTEKMKKATEPDKIILPTEKKEIQKTEPVTEKIPKKTAEIESEQAEEPIVQKQIQLEVLDKLAATEIKSTDVQSESQIRIRGISSRVNSARKNEDSRVHFAEVSDLNPTGQKIVRGKVISIDDSLPLPGVSIVEKDASNGTLTDMEGNFSLKLRNPNDSMLTASFVGMENTEFYPVGDSPIVVKMKPSQLAMEEVVDVGYSRENDKSNFESIRNAHPAGGMNNFKKYIKENAILQENYPDNRVIVRAALKIDTNGRILSVESKNDIEPNLFKTAKELILKGPEWSPKTINGIPVESEVTIRIVFKK